MELIPKVEKLKYKSDTDRKKKTKHRKRNAKSFFKKRKKWYLTRYAITEKNGGILGFSSNDFKQSSKQVDVHPLNGKDHTEYPAKVMYPVSPANAFEHTLKIVPLPALRIRVLSLFDGIATALFILEKKLNLDVEVYFSCEIEEKALRVQRGRAQGKIVQLGNVNKLDETLLSCLGRIDLVIGASPCNELSLVNWRGRGLDDPESSGHLFYSFKRVMNYFLQKMTRNNLPFFWLYENTSKMRISTRDKISSELGNIPPVTCCASQYLPVTGKRFFWGNIPCMSEKEYSEDKKTSVPLQQFLKPDRKANLFCAKTLTTNNTNKICGKTGKLPVTMHGKECFLTINEIEALMGFPEHYSDVDNLTPRQRLQLLAKGWCVPMVEDLLKPLSEIYIHRQY